VPINLVTLITLFFDLGENLDKEAQLIELRNQVKFSMSVKWGVLSCLFIGSIVSDTSLLSILLQCRIIRTTELAAAQEKLNDSERQKQDIEKSYSPASLLHKLQGKL